MFCHREGCYPLTISSITNAESDVCTASDERLLIGKEILRSSTFTCDIPNVVSPILDVVDVFPTTSSTTTYKFRTEFDGLLDLTGRPEFRYKDMTWVFRTVPNAVEGDGENAVTGISDVVVTITTRKTKTELVDVMASCIDGHTMCRTLSLETEYTDVARSRTLSMITSMGADDRDCEDFFKDCE